MLVSLSTLLARNKRRKHALLACRFSDIQIAVAAVRAAEASNSPVLLSLDTSRPLLYSAEFIISTVLQLARLTNVEVSLEVITEPAQQYIDQMLDAGALAVTPLSDNISREQLYALLSWTHKRAVAYGAETVAHTATRKDLQTILHLIENTGVQAARIAFHKSEKGDLNIAEVSEVVKHGKVPILVEEAQFTPHQLKKLFSAGVSAVTLGVHLEESYTGGLRTGLRNRSNFLPSHYQRPAMLAVEENIANYIQHLN